MPTEGGDSLSQNPFASLDKAGLPEKAPSAGPAPGRAPSQSPAGRGKGNRGRVDIIRETGGRAGRTVTVVSGFIGIGGPEKESLAKQMRAACGCGGTVKEGRIEIQGDQRETVARILAEAGFRPVFAGG
ncbi:MAG: translation initiation factor [Opitutaceae bacterium]